MKIALIGFGGMGKAVKIAAEARGHEISCIVDPSSEHNAPFAGAAGVDIAVDFSLPEAVFDNVALCREAGVPLVMGTTGWYEREDEMKAACEGMRFMWSGNFSIGVNLYFRVIEAAAKAFDKFEEYDVWGHEIHHNGKADSPSGTAKMLEKILVDNLSAKDSVVEEKLDRRRSDREIHFSSVRGGPVNFGHTIGFDSAADRVLITHEARCRDGYALGAVKAAEWLVGQDVGFYSMEDFLT